MTRLSRDAPTTPMAMSGAGGNQHQSTVSLSLTHLLCPLITYPQASYIRCDVLVSRDDKDCHLMIGNLSLKLVPHMSSPEKNYRMRVAFYLSFSLRMFGENWPPNLQAAIPHAIIFGTSTATLIT